MANVSLQPAAGEGPTTDELIAGVDRGIYIVGDKSWSIDMQRHNFQFTGQRFFRIEKRPARRQLRDVAYQATTTEFWGAMEAVGGRSTYLLGGAFNCGKGQPGQVGAGQPRLLRRRCSAASTCSTRAPRRDDEPRTDGRSRPRTRGRRDGARRIGRRAAVS